MLTSHSVQEGRSPGPDFLHQSGAIPIYPPIRAEFAGGQLMEGPSNPHDILRVLGDKELQKYLLNEIQEVYRLAPQRAESARWGPRRSKASTSATITSRSSRDTRGVAKPAT